MCKLQAHICNINFILCNVIFDLFGRTFPAGCSWSQDMAGREGGTGIRGGFSVETFFLSTCDLLIPCSHETEEEDAKDSWQQDEFRVMLWPWGQASVNTQFSCVLSNFRLGVKQAKGAGGRERASDHRCQSWPGYLGTDPHEGAQLGAVETLKVLCSAPCSTNFGWGLFRAGWLASGGPVESAGRRATMTTEYLVWGRDGDPERQHPCNEHGGKGTLGILPQCSVFLRESAVELRLASSLRGPNPTIFPPPVTISSSSSLHPHPPPVLLSVNNSFWLWTSRDQQILEGGGEDTCFVLVFSFLSWILVFELEKK